MKIAMKTTEADILEVEDPTKKARSQKAFEALNHIFSGKENGLIDSVLNDYTPVTKVVNGQKVTQAPGLSWDTIFKAIGFAISVVYIAYTSLQKHFKNRLFKKNY